MATFEPLTDFDWLKVNWEAPDQLRTEHCSYCGDKFPEHGTEARAAFIPLIISTNTGCVAEFCEPCQMTWWGLHWDPDRIGFGPHEPEIGHPADCQICEDAGCPACEGEDADLIDAELGRPYEDEGGTT